MGSWARAGAAQRVAASGVDRRDRLRALKRERCGWRLKAARRRSEGREGAASCWQVVAAATDAAAAEEEEEEAEEKDTSEARRRCCCFCLRELPPEKKMTSPEVLSGGKGAAVAVAVPP